MAFELGGGTTITFGTTGATKAVTAVIESIGGNTESVPDVNTSHLGTTGYETYTAGDLDEPGEFTYVSQWDGQKDFPSKGVSETITITYANTATYAGTAYIRDIKLPDVANNEGMRAEVTVKWDGKTGPAFTKYTP
jgi:hypothetical protein